MTAETTIQAQAIEREPPGNRKPEIQKRSKSKADSEIRNWKPESKLELGSHTRAPLETRNRKCLPVCRSVGLSVCQSVSLSVCRSVSLSVCLSACRPAVCLPACLSLTRTRAWPDIGNGTLRSERSMSKPESETGNMNPGWSHSSGIWAGSRPSYERPTGIWKLEIDK